MCPIIRRSPWCTLQSQAANRHRHDLLFLLLLLLLLAIVWCSRENIVRHVASSFSPFWLAYLVCMCYTRRQQEQRWVIHIRHEPLVIHRVQTFKRAISDHSTYVSFFFWYSFSLCSRRSLISGVFFFKSEPSIGGDGVWGKESDCWAPMIWRDSAASRHSNRFRTSSFFG